MAISLFDGITVDWGFSPADIFSNGMSLTLTLATFVLLGIAISYVPTLIGLLRDAVSPK